MGAVLLVSCSGSEQQPTGALARDSAGIRIIETTSPILHPPPEWTLDTVPAMEVTRTGKEPLHRVAGLVHLANGEVVIASNGSSRLDYFDATGG